MLRTVTEAGRTADGVPKTDARAFMFLSARAVPLGLALSF
jgi:hypothetical protein